MYYRFVLLLLTLIAVTPVPVLAEEYAAGRNAYVDGDYEKAYRILKPLAEKGNPEAQKFMGVMYDYGHGVKADPEQALAWYKRAAEHGDASVEYQIGAKYFRGEGAEKDYTEAVKWWTLAAEGGQMDAQFNLGLMYHRGVGVERDDPRAAQLFQQAAEQGHAHAQYSLAVMYSFGHGVVKDYQTALTWYRKSSEQGIAQAQFNIGVFYENGYGIEKDPEAARKWYERASAQGLEQAKEKLDKLGKGGPKQQTAALSVPTAEYSIDEILPDSIKREEWVLKQRPDTYTIQIISLVVEKDVVNYIKTNGLESDVAYIKVVIDGVTRYNALYGVYENYEQAQKAAAELPNRMGRVKPWVRNFGILQGLLRK